MYVDNVTKNALGLTGVTNPTQAELEAAVTATGYTGYVSMEFEAQRGADGDDGDGAREAIRDAIKKPRTKPARATKKAK